MPSLTAEVIYPAMVLKGIMLMPAKPISSCDSGSGKSSTVKKTMNVAAIARNFIISDTSHLKCSANAVTRHIVNMTKNKIPKTRFKIIFPSKLTYIYLIYICRIILYTFHFTPEEFRNF